MTLTQDEIQKIGLEEEQRWRTTHAKIQNEILRSLSDMRQDDSLSRELNAQIVAATRDEEKAALASDEAVAHGLAKLRRNQSHALKPLLDQPYFARVVTLEADRQIEFFLSTASFPEGRIIDWRKGPISKLYYDFKQGDEFDETIQGKDRYGKILIRRSFQGFQNELFSIEIPEGILVKKNDEWILQKNQGTSRSMGQSGHLPPILSLITPDQYKLITQDALMPLIIQGIAGSGKTTVALHRLAWLLHESNSNNKPENSLVVMFNRALKNYVQTTLPELNVDGVPIKTFHQWVIGVAKEFLGPIHFENPNRNPEYEFFKSSTLILNYLKNYFQSKQISSHYIEELIGFYSYLANQELSPNIKTNLNHQIKTKKWDIQDYILLLHFYHHLHGQYPKGQNNCLGQLDHLVIDEAQDFGVVEIKALLYALKPGKTVTLVGDVAQKIMMDRDFESWEIILEQSGFKQHHPIVLSVSHRTTREIMKIANHVRQAQNEDSQTTRTGPEPHFISCGNPETLPDFLAQWIKARTDEAPHSLGAVICRSAKQARELKEKLQKLGLHSVRLGYRDEFDFSPGMIITNIHQVKGLEFRHVLVLDADETNYHSGYKENRHLLYVAVTRSEFKLDFMGSKPITSLLPSLQKAKATD